MLGGIGEVQASVQRVEKGQQELRNDLKAEIGALSKRFDDSLKIIDDRFAKDESEIQSLQQQMSSLQSVVESLRVRMQEHGKKAMDAEGDAPDRKRRCRGRSVDSSTTTDKAAQMIRLSGYSRNLDRDQRKLDITKHYNKIVIIRKCALMPRCIEQR